MACGAYAHGFTFWLETSGAGIGLSREGAYVKDPSPNIDKGKSSLVKRFIHLYIRTASYDPFASTFCNECVRKAK